MTQIKTIKDTKKSIIVTPFLIVDYQPDLSIFCLIYGQVTIFT
ncbi:hypothetical protein ESCAB7627_3711 [Escherichia albertii TW07627]|uniref:Uncharacterized protein n=1 Tax=Escherichia albertii (strain TW07627) TaxID=502347 RepID=A0ABC9NLS8_ESCAT|nr:hypothetical protein ESCAB7627_3711 [Escherichia albertii TW07627]